MQTSSPVGEVKIGLRFGERVLRSGRNDPVNRGGRPPDRCSASKKASAFTHASQESQGRVRLCASPRGSCRATIDIVHRDISFYRPLSFSVPDSNDGARGAVVNSRALAGDVMRINRPGMRLSERKHARRVSILLQRDVQPLLKIPFQPHVMCENISCGVFGTN